MAGAPKDQTLETWTGAFGDAYVDRNRGNELLPPTLFKWSTVLWRLQGRLPKSCIEIGANVGLNLIALKTLIDIECTAIEPNDKALSALVASGVVPADRAIKAFGHSVPLPDASADLAFTSGVLIHVHPDRLTATIDEIYRLSKRYIATIEYFAPGPEEIRYRGHEGLMFRNDYGSAFLDRHPDLTLIDNGFFWKPTTQLDNLTWWLFEKRLG